MIHLRVEQIDGRYCIRWEDHDGHGGEVVGSDQPSIESAIDLLNELYLTLVAHGLWLMRTDGSNGPRLAVDTSTARIEAATGRKLVQRKG
jgi:hypothetical protein